MAGFHHRGVVEVVEGGVRPAMEKGGKEGGWRGREEREREMINFCNFFGIYSIV